MTNGGMTMSSKPVRNLMAAILAIAGSLAVAAPASGAGYSFSFASGFVSPAAFACTTTCFAGDPSSIDGGLTDPMSAAVIGGEVFVSDPGGSRIVVFDTATGAFVRNIGVGELSGPQGITAVGSDLYVVNSGWNRIDVYTAATGAFVRALGKNVGGPGTNVCTIACASGAGGGEAGGLSGPHAVDEQGGEVYVTEINNRRVSVFDADDGSFLRAFGKDVNTGAGSADLCTTDCQGGSNDTGGPAELKIPRGIAVSDSGKVYVTDEENAQRLTVYTTAGVFVRALGKNVNTSGSGDPNVCTTDCQYGESAGDPGTFAYPRGAAIENGHLYVNNADMIRTDVYDATTGDFEYAVGTGVDPEGGNVCTIVTGCESGVYGSGAGEQMQPYGFGVGGGRIYYADTHNDRVTVFDAATGAFVNAYGARLGPGPCTITCSRGRHGSQAGQFVHPTGAAVHDGELFVADASNGRVAVFDASTGAYTRTFGPNVNPAGGDTCTTSCQSGGMVHPTDLAVDGSELWVAEGDGDRITVYDAATGTFERAYGKNVGGAGFDTCTSSCTSGTRGTGAGFLQASYGIAVGGGHFFVGDYLNRRIDQFTLAGEFVRAFGDGVNASGTGNPDICTVATGCQEGTGSINVGPGYFGGELYVPQPERAMVKVYDPATGAFVRAFGKDVGGPGVDTCSGESCQDGTGSSAAGGFSSPWKIVFLGTHAFVSDTGNRRVSVYDASTGVFEMAIGKDVDSVTADDTCTTNCRSGAWDDGAPGGMLQPRGMAIGPDATIYMADDVGQRVAAYANGDDLVAPTTTDDVPSSGYRTSPVVVTLTAADGGSGVDKTYYTTGASPTLPTTSSSVYNPAAKPTLADGEKIRYFSTDLAGNAEAPHTSSAAKVDGAAPVTTDDVPSGDVSGAVSVTLTAADSGSSGVDKTYYTTGASPAEPTTASAVYDPGAKPTLGDGERIRYFSTDAAGNAETPHSSGAVRVATSGGGDDSSGGGSGDPGGGGGSLFTDDSSGGGDSGDGSTPAGPVNRCAGKKNAALLKCRAYVDYKAFMAKCDVLGGAAHKRSCVKRATRSYQQALALIQCRKLKGKARKRCERKARETRAVARSVW
jgi:hypothetical protein